jgi:hypothetical protein
MGYSISLLSTRVLFPIKSSEFIRLQNVQVVLFSSGIVFNTHSKLTGTVNVAQIQSPAIIAMILMFSGCH